MLARLDITYTAAKLLCIGHIAIRRFFENRTTQAHAMYAYASSSTRAEYVRNPLGVATKVHIMNTKTNAQLRWTPQVNIFPEQTHVHTHDNKQTIVNKSSPAAEQPMQL